MPGVSDTCTALYADGWDGTVVNPLDRAAARARDAAGEPYAVLLLTGGRPRVLLHLAWADDYCGVTALDRDGRRLRALDLRRTPGGDLFLREGRVWPRGDDPGAPRRTATWTLAGRREDLDEPAGDRGGSSRQWADEAPRRLPRPAFGDWGDLLELAGAGRPAVTDAAGHDLPVTAAGGPPWRAPRPAGPRDLAMLFSAGAEGAFGGRRGVVELVAAGDLRLTSGRLVAADPEVLGEAAPPFTAAVAPGTYPVTVSCVRFAGQPGHVRVAAARLQVTGRPVARWALALQDGQSLLDLGAGEFYGFGVDSGHASFADADVWRALAARDGDGRDAWEDRWADLGQRAAREQFVVVDDGAMVAWPSGWGDGSYPTWVGHDAAGEVACFVADMRL